MAVTMNLFEMLFLAIVSILFAGFASAAMSFAGFYSFYRSRKWQHLVGGVMQETAVDKVLYLAVVLMPEQPAVIPIMERLAAVRRLRKTILPTMCAEADLPPESLYLTQKEAGTGETRCQLF